MDISLPYDILHLISYHLPPKHLSINKELRDIYNDIWYYDKLQMLNQNLKLYKTITWKNLYQRYLKEGEINVFNLHCDVRTTLGRGIKAAYCGINDNNLILRFNGDL